MTKLKLSAEGEREYLDTVNKSVRRETTIRQFESDRHQDRQERLTDSRAGLDQQYRVHVSLTNFLNILQTVALLAVCVAFIRYIN